MPTGCLAFLLGVIAIVKGWGTNSSYLLIALLIADFFIVGAVKNSVQQFGMHSNETKAIGVPGIALQIVIIVISVKTLFS
jgi:hypothetical protein